MHKTASASDSLKKNNKNTHTNKQTKNQPKLSEIHICA